MSYPSLSGYASYYSTSSNANPPDNFNSARQPANVSAYPNQQSYQSDGRQAQYNSAPQNWSGAQNQQSYHGEQQAYGNGSWKGGETQPTYEYRADSSYYASQAPPVSYSQAQHAGLQNTQTQNTQGLDHLAYASGLDNATMSRQTAAPAYPPVANPSHQNRVDSPMSNSAGRQQTRGRHSMESSSVAPNPTSGQNPAIAAAAALAGAVNRRFTQSNAPATTSPAFGNAPVSTAPIPQRNNSPVVALVRPSNTSNPPAPRQQVGYSTVPERDKRAAAAKAITNNTSLHQKQGREVQHSKTNSRQSQASIPPITAPAPVQNPSSIANLVTPPQLPVPPPQQESEQYTIPTYIDPSQVFNPYHREHMQRRLDVEEAKRKQAEADAALAKADAKAEARRELDRAASTAQKSSTPQNSKPITATAPEKATTTKTPITGTTTSIEDEMALEMKAMLDKMKDFRTKDPGLFQRLWDDMRKGASGTNATANTGQTPSPQLVYRQNVPPASAPVAQSTITKSKVQNSSLPTTVANQTTSATASATRLNGYKVVVEDNPEGLPDLGRFPAERRVRQSYKGRSESATPGLGTSETARETIDLAKNTPEVVTSLATTSSMAIPQSAQAENPDAASAVFWPVEKRTALAEVVVKSLLSVPANRPISLTVSDVLAMLTKNPTYIELCDILEKRGLKFQRSIFARQLLNSVPDLVTPQKTSTPSLSQQATNSAPLTDRAVFGPVNGEANPAAWSLPPATYLPTTKQERVFYGPPKTEGKHGKNQAKTKLPSQSIPGSKEALARKRDFSELVDMTQLSDNDDYVSSQKRVRRESPEIDPSRLGLSILNQPQAMPQGTPLRFDAIVQQPRENVPLPLPHRPKDILARPLANQEALRKSYYDPKTVARDILIASGRHPTERALNAHMAGTIGVHIELNSDLSTFVWDAIDPGGPAPPQLQLVDVPAGPPIMKRGPRKHTGMTGESSALPKPERSAHASAAAPAMPTNMLARFSTQAKELLRESLPTAHETKPSKLRNTHIAEDETHFEDKKSAQRLRRTSRISVESSLLTQDRSCRASSQQIAPSKRSEEMDESGGRRRGRPPGAKNKHPSITAMKSTAKAITAPHIEINIPPASPQGNFVFRCKWIRCHANLHNLATLRQHVLKVHVPDEQEVAEKGYVCWWKGCDLLARDDTGMITVTKSFTDRQQWSDHIEEHLHIVGKKYGDGPSTKHIDWGARTCSHIDPQSLIQDKTRYLSDAHGRITTPSLSMKSNHSLPQDALILTKANAGEADAYAHRSFLKAHRTERLNPRIDAEETLRAMEARKAKIGPAIDRGGCILVNEARRETFVQNPGIQREVDADY